MPRIAFLILVFLTPVFAQTATTGDVPTLQSTAKLVVVDVVVTDKQHRPVHGLKANDFGVLENKAPQTVLSFEEHGVPGAVAPVVTPMPKMAAGMFTNYAPSQLAGPVTVLLLDTLNTPMQDQAIVRQQLLDYLHSSKSDAHVAIFGLTTQLLMLQDFTSDPAVLKHAVSVVKSEKGSPMLAAKVSGDDFDLKLSDELENNGQATAQVIARVATFEAVQQSLQMQMRAKFTLDALNTLARYLVGIPGRKNVIWFSGSFPIDVLPDTTHTAAALAASARRLPTSGSAAGGDPFEGVASAEEEFRETTDLLTASQVAVYPVQAHGLTDGMTFSAENGGNNSGVNYGRSPSAFANEATASFLQTASGDHTMLRLAEETGGEAFLQGNGLAEAVHQAMDNGSSYYTLTYRPSNADWHGDYRELQVRLADNKSYTLSYRRGYYADPPEAGGSGDANTLQRAIQFGAPPATQVLMRVKVQPVAGEPGEAAAGDKPIPDAKKGRVLYRRVTVDYSADPRAIAFETLPDGGRRGKVEFVTCVYTDTGTLANTKYQSLTVNLTPSQYESALKIGLNYRQEVGIPVEGKYLLRAGVHDVKADRIGTVDVPMSAIAR
jgi:VWFA-related protein